MSTAITILGNVQDVTYRPVINILPGTILKAESTGIYAAGNGLWNINGATVSGSTGIEIRAGDMNINGSTIIETGIPNQFTLTETDQQPMVQESLLSNIQPG
ncbi:MAG: hypothetical protein IJX35_00925, partial [Candidatus Methanomethylophilaceae archaeon]|nr:hypothetical protein [Candidatus Methanomethylophilaceae archaeon]